MHRLQEIDDRSGGTPTRHFIVRMTVGTSSRQPLCIIAAALALVVASSTAMAEPKKRSVSDKATHRTKSVPAPLRQWPPDNPTPREYEELKREGWYKADKA